MQNIVIFMGLLLSIAPFEAASAQTSTSLQGIQVASPTATETPPSPYCIMTGRVVNLLKGVGANAMGETVNVPVAQVAVESNTPINEDDQTGFCAKMVGSRADGTAPVVNFRVCDVAAEFYVSDRIRAVAGRNLGGGYYCIDQITRSLQ